VVDIFSHGRMPILAVSRLHLIDPSSIEHTYQCLLKITQQMCMKKHALLADVILSWCRTPISYVKAAD